MVLLGVTSMSKSEKTASRRGMLAVLGLTGAAAATLTALPRQSADSETSTTAESRPKPEKGGGYALTEHVKRYYKTTLV
jgi:hypothetical protein